MALTARRRSRHALLLTLLSGIVACGGDGGTGPGPTYESIAGTYSGTMVGLAQGVAMNSTFSLTISQTGGSTSGTWALSGVLNDGVDALNVTGTGTLTGTVSTGNNPSVNITVRTPACPDYQAAFSGAYDSANRRLTIVGPVEFFAANSCTVVLSYAATIILTR